MPFLLADSTYQARLKIVVLIHLIVYLLPISCEIDVCGLVSVDKACSTTRYGYQFSKKKPRANKNRSQLS